MEEPNEGNGVVFNHQSYSMHPKACYISELKSCELFQFLESPKLRIRLLKVFYTKCQFFMNCFVTNGKDTLFKCSINF